MKISKLTVTPVATHDQPLLNSTGVHESYRTRTVVQIETADGYTGVGETSGNAVVEVEANRNWIEGYDPRQMTRARLLWSGTPRAWAAVETAIFDCGIQTGRTAPLRLHWRPRTGPGRMGGISLLQVR